MEPLLRLVRGHPGSGKTEVLRWIRQYFEQVWSWTLGVQFAFTAPLNSMASNINGDTVHSWGQVGFKERRGATIAPHGGKGLEEVPTMGIRCNAVRFLFIDEIEATGADTIGILQEKVLLHVSTKSPFRYRDESKEDVRPFGWMNVCFLGDFWQLAPTGQVAIMSDVNAKKVRESAKSSHIMNIF